MTALALFIDASYLHAQVGKALGGNYPKQQVQCVVEAQVVVERLIEAGCRVWGHARADVLRLYWYEPSRDGAPNADQRSLGLLDDVHLRLSPPGSRTVSAGLSQDLGGLAAQRAISHAVLLSAETDLLPSLMLVQTAGVRLALLGLVGQGLDQEVASGQSHELCLAVDRVRCLDLNDWVDLYQLQMRTRSSHKPGVAQPAEPLVGEDLRSAVQDFWADLGQTPSAQELSPSIAPELDRALLSWVRQRVGRLLDDAEKRQARAHFRSLARS